MPTIKKKVAKKTPADRGEGILSRIEEMVPEDESEGIKVNLYGRSGSGKTTLWSTFPEPILAIICSGSHRPGELKSINTPRNRQRIKKFVLRDPDEVFALASHQEATGEFATVVLDHASGLQDYVLKKVMNLAEVPTQLSWGIATQQDWGQVALQTKELLRALLNLSCNVVIVAQEREFDGGQGDQNAILLPNVGSALTPSVTGWLNPACDYICHTFIRGKTEELVTDVAGTQVKTKVRVEGVEYCLRTAPHDVYTTKFRVPRGKPLPEVLVDPSYQKIINLIRGK